jgi:hypothetical protein
MNLVVSVAEPCVACILGELLLRLRRNLTSVRIVSPEGEIGPAEVRYERLIYALLWQPGERGRVKAAAASTSFCWVAAATIRAVVDDVVLVRLRRYCQVDMLIERSRETASKPSGEEDKFAQTAMLPLRLLIVARQR